MPAINVARTDTFEQQRLKINEIGSQVFGITQGGSDLSTGNLKLGDGTRSTPSLGFTSDSSLGIYRPTEKTIGIVANSKVISDLGLFGNYFYKDVILQKRFLTTSGCSISNTGINYDAGTYSDIPLLGGTGEGSLANLTVEEFVGQIVNTGNNYTPGSYTNKILTGGSGTNSLINFTVDAVDGIITNNGSGYIPGLYSNIPLSGGSGTGALADFNITGTTDITGSITNPGSGYLDGTYTNRQLLNQPIQTFIVTVVSNPGTPPPNNVYQIDGVTQDVLTLEKGNTYKFDLSDSSLSGHPFYLDALSGFLNISDYNSNSKGIIGTPNACLYFTIKSTAPTETIKYDCSSHPGMGANINIVDGTLGYYGTGLSADFEISSGSFTSFTVANSGSDYKVGDVLEVFSDDYGGGSGFTFTIGNIVYNGSVNSITVTNSGQNYLNGDSLSVDNTNIGGFGSGFIFDVSTNPGIIDDIVFVNKGSGNVAGESLSLPGNIAGVNVSLDSLSVDINVPDASLIGPGFSVVQTSGSGVLGSGVTVQSVNALLNVVTLSSAPQTSGSATLTFIPDYGSPTTDFEYSILKIGPVTSFSISGEGNGYTDQDILSVNSINLTQPVTFNVIVNEVQSLILSGSVSSSTFSPGDTIKIPDGEIQSVFISQSTSIQSAENQTFSGISPSNGSGSGFLVDITRVLGGSVGAVTIVNGGLNYQNGDTLLIPGNLVGGSSPTDDIELSVTNVTQSSACEIYKVNSTAGIIDSIVCEYIAPGFSDGDSIIKSGSPGTSYSINTASSQEFRYFIDSGSGFDISPALTLFSGNKYRFDYSSNTNNSHQFTFSAFPDGKWGPSLVQNVNTTLSLTSKEITVSSTSGILPGMEVTVSGGVGLLPTGTFVDVVVNATTILLTEFPIATGSTDLDFFGVPYTDGVVVTSNYIEISVSDQTPNLYYYSTSNPNMGGSDNLESLLTIDLNNPKVFGSDFELLVSSISRNDIIKGEVTTGSFTSESFSGSSASFGDVDITNTLTSNRVETSTLEVENIISTSNIDVTTPNFSVSDDFFIGQTVQITGSTGKIETSGEIKTSSSLNVNNVLNITNATISSSGSLKLEFIPAAGQTAKFNTTSALVIPVGTSLERPGVATRENGAIRFNTTTNQYEGYSAANGSWSSLGGVRDLDGNTTILAEETVGANDNTLWFINDSVNSIRVSRDFLEFRNAKKISSGRLGIPAFTLWTANTPVIVGQYLKYRNNLYEVTAAGTTATSGNEPTHTSGIANNGTAQLTWHSLSVSPLEFTEIQELRVGPNKDCPLIVSAELKLLNNTISTLVEDLVLTPNLGKKVTVNATSSFVVPVGNSNQRGSAAPGSIRYNTTISQFEGYSGTNWSSLGGVRDVDGNTYIIPETTPGANENILYFYNNNVNTIKLSETELDFTNIDTITTTGGNSLALNTEILTLNSSDTTIDNTDASSTFISTTKQYLDLGLSSGLNVDPVLRLDDEGDVYLNVGFGTGTFNGVKIFDGDLKDFELADYAVKTNTFSLTKGSVNSTSSVLYSPANAKGCKVTVVSKSSSGKKSMAEYSVIDNGTDIFFTEIGSLNTSAEGFSAAFDFTPGNETRITLTLSNDHTAGDVVQFTVLTQTIK